MARGLNGATGRCQPSVAECVVGVNDSGNVCGKVLMFLVWFRCEGSALCKGWVCITRGGRRRQRK